MIPGCELLFNIAVVQNVNKMRKLLKLFFPVLTGILVMLGILKVGELVKDMADANFSFNPSDMGDIMFYYLLIPVTIIPALMIQVLIIEPIIKKLEHKPTFWRLRLMHYIILFSCIAAGAIGYIFWRKTEVWLDVIVAAITSFVLFFIYFIVTVLLTKGIDQFEIHFEKDKQNGNGTNDHESSTKI